MERIPASKKIRKEIMGNLKGINEGKILISEFLRKGAALIVQELLEEEVTEFLGRRHYERSTESKERGYRNGYEPLKIKTTEGKIEAYKPQVRDSEEPFRSRLAAFFRGNSEMLEKLAAEMYARGLSTRDIENALVEATGEMILSKSAVSKVTEVLYQEFEAFQSRDLSSFEVEYLFLDALYESIHGRYGIKEAVLCGWGVLRSGEKVLLHLGLGNRESYRDWLEFIRDMVKRGLRVPLSVTSDGGKGVVKAIEALFSKSLRMRCWFHRMQNFASKVPEEVWGEVKAEIIAIRDAAGYEQGKQLAAVFIQRYKDEYPMLIRAFKDDLDALLNHLKLPFSHRKYVRTTNLIERSFEEERRRTKVIPCFLTEKSALKLIFSVLIRAAKRWRMVRFSKVEINYLDRLRRELGIPIESEDGGTLREVS